MECCVLIYFYCSLFSTTIKTVSNTIHLKLYSTNRLIANERVEFCLFKCV